jgi:hypothetical protein
MTDGVEANFLLASMKVTFEDCMATARVKNADYTGAGVDTDPFKNFKRAPDLAGVTVERGILVRLSDKLCRLSNILDGPVAVADERVVDTIMDAINYLAILKAYLEYER